MPKDDSMEVRIALLETKVDDLLFKAIELRRDSVTPADISHFQREVDCIRDDVERVRLDAGARFLRMEDRIIRLERDYERLNERVASAQAEYVSKAELHKTISKSLVKSIALQTAINAAMLMIVVQFLR
ncbi:hypothetical protein [Duganella sp. Root1480D1]|uniref:hypothetical protein n=1 Tax=Duganella sp. Root1480D1 TaxID=1736471 RepID=UPI00070DE29B|nr:hypothetical protein [Duganella sp. Root1480D1]KQZ44114.1 hypothetical protein ASD58_20525 [Duganella sp. Root1480D1]